MSKHGMPAVPTLVKFDPEASFKTNAEAAWERERAVQRTHNEHNLRVCTRRVFKCDDFEIKYYEQISLTIPTFEVEGEVIAFAEGHLHLVEFCGDCGKVWNFRRFNSLAGLGRVLEEFENDPDPFTCRLCLFKAQISQGKKKHG